VVCHAVGLAVTVVSPAKAAEAIKLPLGMLSLVGPSKRVLDRFQISHAIGQF